MKNIRNILFFTLFLFFSNKSFASSKLLFDLGRFSLPIVFNNEDISLCPTIVIPELFVINDKTGLYLNYSPFEIKFKYSKNDYRYEEYTQSWEVADVTFVNTNFGWMKKMNKYFLFESYIRINTVSAMDITKICFSPTLEISLLSSYLDVMFNPEKEYFISKALSIQVGATFNNKKNFKPDFFVSTSIDFILFAGLLGIFFHI